MYLLRQVGTKEMVKSRQAFYSNRRLLTGFQLKLMVDSIALTARLHPWSLGMEPQADGQIWVGRDIKIQCKIVDNLFEMADIRVSSANPAVAIRRAYKTMSITNTGNDQQIPPRCWEVKSVGNKHPKLVIVTEHLNIGTSLR